MKKPDAGMIVSGAAHAAVLAYAVIGFNSVKAYDPYKEALPVEVLTLSEFDQLTKGSNASKKVEDTPKVQAKKIAAVTPDPLPPAPEAKENVTAPPPEPEAVETPPPPPEPPKEEPKKAETPPPPPMPEPKPEEAKKEPEKKVDDKSQADLDKLIKKEVEKKPEKKVEKKPEKPKPKFDPSKIASLVDKRDPGLKPQSGQTLSDVTTAGVSNGAAPKLSLSMQSMIAAMIQEQIEGPGCFNPPPGTIGRNDLVAVVAFNVTEGGVLIGQPKVHNNSGDPMFAALSQSAISAIYKCASEMRPLRLPAEHYDFWKSVVLNVRPPAG